VTSPAGTSSEPLLGIGIPVYNGELYLRQTLDSLLVQTFDDFEIVVADNASTDKTPQIVREVAERDSRVRYVRHERNIGAPRNFNSVFGHTRGQLFAWVAADDLYHPEFLATCVENLGRRPDAVGAFTATLAVDADGVLHDLIEEPVRWDHPDPAVRFADLASFRHACMSLFAVLRRSAVEKTRLKPICWGGDRMFLAELSLHGPMVIDPRPLFHNRQHGGRLSTRSRGNPAAYFVNDRPTRALTWFYASFLWQAVDRAGFDPVQRRRVRRAWAGWAVENRTKLARSAARGVLDVGRGVLLGLRQNRTI
jgi:glycosyltransferase involved in cell wall biosynthesis